MKTLLQSKTFWVAVVQAVGGLAIVALTELDLLGYSAVVKSLVDVILRMITTKPISSIT